MLADVLAAFLDSVTEAEFYPVFQELLRTRAYSEVHLLHGAYEFGKDSIGQRDLDGVLTQYAFQLKAGDLDLGKWRDTKPQIDQIRTNGFGHPGFNRDLPRRGVLVTTGVLKGAAAGDAQEYAEDLVRTSAFRFETWDRSRLVTELLEAPSIGLAGAVEGPLLEMLGRIDGMTATDAEIEHFTARWIGSRDGLARAGLECAVVATRCRAAGRVDLAALTALGLLRAAWASAHGAEPLPTSAVDAAATGRRLFGAFVGELYSVIEDEHLLPRGMLNAHRLEFAFPVTYQVRSLRVAELLALYGLLLRAEGHPRAATVLARLAEFVRQQPGIRHPISDRWAVSLVPVILAVAAVDRELAAQTIRDTLKWVIDHYDKAGAWGLGLAEVTSTPEIEIEYLLGGPLEHVARERRSHSYLATVLIDLAGLLGLDVLYADAVNDVEAVEAYPVGYTIADSVGQYITGGAGDALLFHPKIAYAEVLPIGRPIASHHRPGADFPILRAGHPWDLLAISALLRDRHWPAAAKMLL